jgi:transcriptional regulator with XRE-family HTH domain
METPEHASREAIAATIGRRIRARQYDLKMQQRTLAIGVGISNGLLGRRIRGEINWSPDELARAAIMLDTSVAYLIGETNEADKRPNRAGETGV